MNEPLFDRLARALAGRKSRRSALRSLGVAVAAGASGVIVPRAGESRADVSCPAGQTPMTICVPAGGQVGGQTGGQTDVPNCGAINQACCFGISCFTGLACVDGVCAGTDRPTGLGCGGMSQACCAGDTCSSGLTCQGGVCTGCGGSGQPCCGGSTCTNGGCCDASGVCQPGTAAGACGSGGGACQACTTGLSCVGGACLTCGGQGQQCCGGSTCASGYTCQNGVCMPTVPMVCSGTGTICGAAFAQGSCAAGCFCFATVEGGTVCVNNVAPGPVLCTSSAQCAATTGGAFPNCLPVGACAPGTSICANSC